MRFIQTIFSNIGRFLTRRFLFLIRLLVGMFMIFMGIWFSVAPITQQFFLKQDALQDAPYLWLIVPLGILQITIGFGILRPLFKKKQ